jgi:hypothetical protein
MGKTLSGKSVIATILLTLLSIFINFFCRCFKASPINPKHSGVLQYQQENIYCFNVTHESTGF